MSEQTNSSIEVWSRFWRQGHATTFGNYYDKGYQGPVLNWLKGVLPASTLQADKRILELCCGNGSLIPFLLDSETQCHYTGIDSADVIIPAQYKERIESSSSSFELRPTGPLRHYHRTCRS